MNSYKVVVEDMHCQNCVRKIKEALESKGKDVVVSADLNKKTLTPSLAIYRNRYLICIPNQKSKYDEEKNINKEIKQENKEEFNIINKEDTVPYLPPEEVGLTTYGVNKVASVKDNLIVWNSMFPNVTYKHANYEAFKTTITNVFQSREKAYEIPTDKDGTLVEAETLVKANLLRQSYDTLFENDTPEKVHSFVGPVSKIDEDSYGFYVKSAPILIFDVVNLFVNDPSSTILNIGKIIDFLGLYLPEVLNLMPEVVDPDLVKKFLIPHTIENYYPVLEILRTATN